MAWHPAIPNEVNVVRGASGDLLFIRENFDALSGVATLGMSGLLNASGTNAVADKRVVSWRDSSSAWIASGLRLDRDLFDVTITSPTSGQALTYNGTVWVNATPVQTISGLTDVQLNPPTPLSGQALVYSGTHPTGKWTASSIQINALNDIGDVTITSPVSGEFLRWTGSQWVNSGADGTPQIALRLSGGGSLTVSGTAENRLILQEVAFDSANGFSYSLTSGHVIVSGGISRVDIFGQVQFGADDGDSAMVGFWVNEAPISGVSGWGLPVSGSRDPANTLNVNYVQAACHGVPVASGDRISLVARRNGTGSGIASGTLTWLHVRKAAEVTAGGGGSASAGTLYELFMGPASGFSQNVPTATNVTVTGMNTGNLNRASTHFSLVSAASGIAVVSAGHPFTHIEAVGGITYSGTTSQVGLRRVELRFASGTAALGSLGSALPPTGPIQLFDFGPVTSNDATRLQVHTMLIPVPTGQLSFGLLARHTQGSDLPIISDGGGDSRIFLWLRGWILTSG